MGMEGRLSIAVSVDVVILPSGRVTEIGDRSGVTLVRAVTSRNDM